MSLNTGLVRKLSLSDLLTIIMKSILSPFTIS